MRLERPLLNRVATSRHTRSNGPVVSGHLLGDLLLARLLLTRCGLIHAALAQSPSRGSCHRPDCRTLARIPGNRPDRGTHGSAPDGSFYCASLLGLSALLVCALLCNGNGIDTRGLLGPQLALGRIRILLLNTLSSSRIDDRLLRRGCKNESPRRKADQYLSHALHGSAPSLKVLASTGPPIAGAQKGAPIDAQERPERAIPSARQCLDTGTDTEFVQAVKRHHSNLTIRCP
jgi:hypothetical protein